MKFRENIEQRFTARHKKSLDFSGNLKDRVVLDIGCSFGWFEKFTAESGCKEVIGIDTSDKGLLSAANQASQERVKFLKGSAIDLSIFADNYFDAVVMWEVMEHLPSHMEEKALNGISRVLKPAGSLCISVPNRNFWSCMLDPAWYFGHRHYSEGNIRDILSKSGFRTEKIEYGGGFHELFSMILLYAFKWIFRKEIPFKSWFEKKKEEEYFNTRGFVTLFLKASKG